MNNFSNEFNQGRGLGESYFEDKMQPVIAALEEKGLLTEGKEGAKLVFFPNDKYPPAMILKKDGATLYHTRDLATDLYRKETYGPDLIINEVGTEQTLYFQQLFEMEQMLGWFKSEQRVHVGHGLIRFNDKKMSTRKGNTIWLEDVLEEANKRAFSLMTGKHDIEYGEDYIQTSRKNNPEKTLKFSQIINKADSIGIGALKWNDLKRDPKHSIIFDWDEMLTMEGNSGPYMQYTHARLASVLRKASERGINPSSLDEIDSNDLAPLELSLLRVLYQFPQIVENAAASHAPHQVCTYLFSVAQRFNAFYHQHSILGKDGQNEEEKTKLRLLLCRATQLILSNGLKLLSIDPLEKM